MAYRQQGHKNIADELRYKKTWLQFIVLSRNSSKSNKYKNKINGRNEHIVF